MTIYRIEQDKAGFKIYRDEKLFRFYKKSVIKNFASLIKKAILSQDFEAELLEIEKKALKSYFYFLLSRSDKLSSELSFKAQVCGFEPKVIEEVLNFLKEKNYINDQNLKYKKDIRKIKKGYASRLFNVTSPEATNLEEEALKKLINKKRDLLFSSDIKEKNKAFRFFISRGFCIEKVLTLANNS